MQSVIVIMKCDFNCFECKFPDCILDFEDGSLTDLEIETSLQVDDILFKDDICFNNDYKLIPVYDYRQYPFIPSDEIPYNPNWKSQAKWRAYYRSRARGNSHEKWNAYARQRYQQNKEKESESRKERYARKKKEKNELLLHEIIVWCESNSIKNYCYLVDYAVDNRRDWFKFLCNGGLSDLCEYFNCKKVDMSI